MKLKEYAMYIAKLVERHPDAIMVFSSDDEGNNYDEVRFNPTTGQFSGREFIPNDGTKKFKVTAICVN